MHLCAELLVQFWQLWMMLKLTVCIAYVFDHVADAD